MKTSSAACAPYCSTETGASTFDDPFQLAPMLKDNGIATESGHTAELPTPVSAQQASVGELARWVETMTGTHICAAPA
jgi:3-hydroxyisobutyrate dehydrogenase-like beta-hydroxyacid dehydrogenase